MQRVRIVIEVEVEDPSQHELRELNELVAREAPEFVTLVVGTVFGDEDENYSFENAYVEGLN